MFTNYILLRFVLLYNGCHINKMFPTYTTYIMQLIRQQTGILTITYKNTTAYKQYVCF